MKMGPYNDHDNIDGDARIGTIKFIGLYFCFVFYFTIVKWGLIMTIPTFML